MKLVVIDYDVVKQDLTLLNAAEGSLQTQTINRMYADDIVDEITPLLELPARGPVPPSPGRCLFAQRRRPPCPGQDIDAHRW